MLRASLCCTCDVCNVSAVAMSYGGNCDLLYSQFELHTREQKMNQIVLLKVNVLLTYLSSLCPGVAQKARTSSCQIPLSWTLLVAVSLVSPAAFSSSIVHFMLV